MNQPDIGALHVQRNVRLADFTTLGLGGNAKYFVECTSVEHIRVAIKFAQEEKLPVQVLGGGSNTIFLDEGFEGLVLKIALRGVHFIRQEDDVKMVVAAGEVWDDFVKLCISYHLAGVECLSGIPGLVGATPIQNVGAYGQEVSDTIVMVKALERRTLKEVTFSNNDCRFSYRRSRFNYDDVNRFIITEVTFKLKMYGEPEIQYPELRKHIDSNGDWKKLEAGSQKLEAVRKSVLSLRRKKSMVVDPADPNSKSVGSFFKNPILSKPEFAAFEGRCRENGITGTIPTFPAGYSTKVPAAWLVENAGFNKGYRKGGVGVSANHTLALVNYGGTTKELLALAEEIQSTVARRFGVRLEREPIIVQST